MNKADKHTRTTKTSPMKPEQITLFYKQEKSDKVYKASLEAQEEGLFTVNFAYGRRGSTLKTGTKTQTPISYEKAKKIYDKLVYSKASKGYVPNEDSSDYVYESDQVKTGIHCQLLNPIEEEALHAYLEDDAWWAQEKMDGKRLLIKKTDDLIAINRKGFSVGAPQAIIDSASKSDNSFIIDGEAVGDTLFVFDLLFLNGEDLKTKPYQSRYQLLCQLKLSGAIKVVPTATSCTEKLALVEKLKSTNSEGIVLKNHTAPYHAGRPNSGGNQLKFKFYETASVIVTKINDKRSVGMSLLENGKEIFVGNVTIAVNKEIPKEGAVIEVRYLYAYKGGSLYQPTFLNVRTDIEAQECVLSQLKYKQV